MFPSNMKNPVHQQAIYVAILSLAPLLYIYELEAGVQPWPSFLCIAPISLACSLQYFAMNVSLPERPRGMWVVQFIETDPVL